MRRPVTVMTLVLAWLFVVGLPAGAEDPAFVAWSSAAPALTSAVANPDPDLCRDGQDRCVHGVIKEMDKRFRRLGCHHDAVFALTYLRTTEEYHRFWHEDRFADPVWLHHYDVVFGDFYFRAYDDYHGGARDRVPPAWAIAFEASAAERVSATGNVLLGINGHINRDLPFTLYAIGLVAPDGTSRKPDHDLVNEFLNRVSDDLYPELAARFDPTVDDGGIDGTTLDDFASFQSIPAMREAAWRNAERLANAASEADRQRVAMEIEATAAATAAAIVEATRYSPLSSSSAADRDAYCAANNV